MHPQSEKLLEIITRLGFDFELSSTKAKHPQLLVYYEGIFIPPNLRFSVMRGMLRLAGIEDPPPLRDICFMAAWRKAKQP